MKFKRYAQTAQDKEKHLEKDIKYLDHFYSKLGPASEMVQTMAFNHHIEKESVEEFHKCIDNLNLAIKDIKSHLVYQIVHELSPENPPKFKGQGRSELKDWKFHDDYD